MEFITDPMEIERRSMEILRPHLAGWKLGEQEIKVYSRIISFTRVMKSSVLGLLK